MNRDELDNALRRTSRYDEADLDAVDLEAAETELIDEIRAQTPVSRAVRRVVAVRSHARRRPKSPSRIGSLLVGATTVLAAATVAVLWLGSGGGPDRLESAFAAEAIEVAEANPRLLITEPGWSVTRADGFEVDQGEMTFSDGEHRIDLNWYPAALYESRFDDRTEVDKTPTMLSLLGDTARVVHYEGRPDYAAMLPPQGETFIEIRGNVGSKERYLEVVGSLEPVDVETWLSAMPARLVVPGDRGSVVDEMLQGVPIPPGLDVEELRSRGVVRERYNLGYEVLGSVTCGWLQSWVAARKAGDLATAEAAVEALATSRRWPILVELERPGGFSRQIWGYSRQIKNGNLDEQFTMFSQEPGGPLYGHGPAWATGLGCDDSVEKREVAPDDSK